ncbi:MAG TPA: transglycosylase SLT domain-containing protein [Thermoanaerobaculia bacterium]|nr:transglycosylase SLT domain-containing protein [Thermoanaerobaculia bacterium]
MFVRRERVLREDGLRSIAALAILLLAAACVSSDAVLAPPAAPVPSHAPAAVNPRQPASSGAQRSDADASEFRTALEEAYAQIVSREVKSVSLPAVDVEAAASMPIPDHRMVRNAVHLFTNRMRDDVQKYLLRSGSYRKMIDKALAEQGLPKALAYLPVIESGYSSTLTSRAGAHGIWQFMPETAREYGLRVDWWVDERADPERSTRAAAIYLKDLYRMFGDWPLTLAAYNAGPGRVRRAMEQSGATSFWELAELGALPKETRGYVPTFFATLIIASDPPAYGFTLGAAVDADVRRVDVEGPVSLAFLAEVIEMSEEAVRELNPACRRGMLPPGKMTVRLPSAAAERLRERARTLRNDDERIAVCSFTLREQDSLTRIAAAIGTPVEVIRAMNGLAPQDRVTAGDSLYLPVRSRDLAPLLAASSSGKIYHAVRKGDTLYSVARRYNLTVAELRELNDLPRAATLRRGQKLRVTTSRSATAGGM